jgi:hypothetical protein
MTFGARSLCALTLALWAYGRIGWPSLLLAPVAMVALKGCPTCWAIGLFETLERRGRNGATFGGGVASFDAKAREAAKCNPLGRA